MVSSNFISVSAVSNREQLREINKIYRENGEFPFHLAIGYQVSSKSINQGTQNPRQPKFADLGELSQETWNYRMIPAVHYYTKDGETIISDLEKVAAIIPMGTILQLNILPPSLNVLEKIRMMGFNPIFKVAVSDKQSSEGGYAVWKGEGVQDVKTGEIGPLIEQVRERRGFIDYVMFDPSHGTNLDLTLDENSLAIRFGREIAESHDLDSLGLVYAGGIKPSNVKTVLNSLFTYFPRRRISIDTESGVRTSDNQLDMGLVRQYLENCRYVLER